MENKKSETVLDESAYDKCSINEDNNFGENSRRKKTSNEKLEKNALFQRNSYAASDVFLRHETENIQNEIISKDDTAFSCEKCNFYGKKGSDYNRHINSKKHKKRCGVDEKESEKPKQYLCDCCNKVYIKYSSYWAHMQKCKDTSAVSNINTPATPVATAVQTTAAVNVTEHVSVNDDSKNSIINRLFLENQELRNFVVEQSKEHINFVVEQSKEHIKNTNKLVNKFVKMNKMTSDSTELTNTTNNNNTVNNNNNINNTNNNTINGNVTSNNVNINVFLNDKCKDAVNLTEFIDNVQITNADLENNANSGFVNGISKILIDNLKTLSIYERPIHCTDVKRETMYIKDDHMWSKEEDDKKLKSAIQEISRKIMVQFSQWREDNPDYVDLDSEAGMKYVAITQNSVAGSKRDAYYGKIMKSIAKETVIPR